MYRCEAVSIGGFIQQLAVSYVANGYWFYVTGTIPSHKDPRRTDRKIIAQYDLDLSKWTRARRKRAGHASVQYLRCGHFFVLLATPGEHPFFAAEADSIRDVRKTPIKFGGYAVGCRQGMGQWHPSVRIERETYSRLHAHLIALATHSPQESLAREFHTLPFEPYAPIRRQLLRLLHAVNRLRSTAGLERIPITVLRMRRRVLLPFGPSPLVQSISCEIELPKGTQPAEKPGDRMPYPCAPADKDSRTIPK